MIKIDSFIKLIFSFYSMTSKSKQINSIYDKFAKKYQLQREHKNLFNYNNHIEIPAMLKLLGNIKNKKILDLGSGFGDHASRYVWKGAKEVIGLEISKELVKLANERNIKRAQFIVTNLNKKIPFKNNSFDIVTSSMTIHYIKNLEYLFQEVRRILKKNGIFVFSTGNPVYASMDKDRDNFSYIMGARLMKKGKWKIYGNYFDESIKKREYRKTSKKRQLVLSFMTVITLPKYGYKKSY
jgi:ubiquinone/menaquinone biosynthesis C-methylase UbiE